MFELSKPQQLIYGTEKYVGGAVSVICGTMLVAGHRSEAELKAAAAEIFRLNDALRIRITEAGGSVSQTVIPYEKQEIPVLHFHSKEEMDAYAEPYAQVPIALTGSLCSIQIVVLPEQYGLLVKLHHMVGDAWTLSLIGTQFNMLLSGNEPRAYSYLEYLEKEKNILAATGTARIGNSFYLNIEAVKILHTSPPKQGMIIGLIA